MAMARREFRAQNANDGEARRGAGLELDVRGCLAAEWDWEAAVAVLCPGSVWVELEPVPARTRMRV